MKLELTPTRLGEAGGRKQLSVTKEEDIYEHLKMQYIPPELREDQGEIEAALANRLPGNLIALDDIKGATHCHTVYSDGRNSVEEMALAAEAKGMKVHYHHGPFSFSLLRPGRETGPPETAMGGRSIKYRNAFRSGY